MPVISKVASTGRVFLTWGQPVALAESEQVLDVLFFWIKGIFLIRGLDSANHV